MRYFSIQFHLIPCPQTSWAIYRIPQFHLYVGISSAYEPKPVISNMSAIRDAWMYSCAMMWESINPMTACLRESFRRWHFTTILHIHIHISKIMSNGKGEKYPKYYVHSEWDCVGRGCASLIDKCRRWWESGFIVCAGQKTNHFSEWNSVSVFFRFGISIANASASFDVSHSCFSSILSNFNRLNQHTNNCSEYTGLMTNDSHK